MFKFIVSIIIIYFLFQINDTLLEISKYTHATQFFLNKISETIHE